MAQRQSCAAVTEEVLHLYRKKLLKQMHKMGILKGNGASRAQQPSHCISAGRYLKARASCSFHDHSFMQQRLNTQYCVFRAGIVRYEQQHVDGMHTMLTVFTWDELTADMLREFCSRL